MLTKYIKKSLKESLTAIRSYNKFMKQYKELTRFSIQTNKRFLLSKKDFQPCLFDNTENTGFDRHYIYHPAWALRIIKENNPALHIDISSTLHFCTALSAFIPVEFYDYRPANVELSNLSSLRGNLLSLPFVSDSIKSISCMHTVEHVGLGRYGDSIDYDGDIKAINELKRVLAPEGDLLFVVPVSGTPKIHFNAHRVYTKDMVVELFSPLYLVEFSLIPENEKDGGIVNDPPDNMLNKQQYGCGCFWFKKQANK